MAYPNYLFTVFHSFQMPTPREQKFCSICLFATSHCGTTVHHSDSSQDKAFIPLASEIAVCCQLTAESLFWNCTQLNRAPWPSTLKLSSPNKSVWSYEAPASLPQFRITLKASPGPNIYAFRQDLIWKCITAQILLNSFAHPCFPHFLTDVVPESPPTNVLHTSLHLKSVSQRTKFNTPQILAQYLVHSRYSSNIY